MWYDIIKYSRKIIVTSYLIALKDYKPTNKISGTKHNYQYYVKCYYCRSLITHCFLSYKLVVNECASVS